MDLIQFARGPALFWSIAIMVGGLCWRVGNFITRGPDADLYWARKEFRLPDARWKIESYVMHAGILTVVFGFAPHILLIRELTGLSWPGLPIKVIYFAGSMALIAMAAVLANHFAGNPPRFFSPFDDYFSWGAVFITIATGLIAYPHVGGASLTGPYAILLAAHLFSAEALMIWLPFGKLGHVVLMPLVRSARFIASAFQ